MGATATTEFCGVECGAASVASQRTRRHITPQAGRALEILGHAIEYLTDEYVHQGGALSARDPQLAAVQILMAANREVYYSCPAVPALSERLAGLLRRLAA